MNIRELQMLKESVLPERLLFEEDLYVNEHFKVLAETLNLTNSDLENFAVNMKMNSFSELQNFYKTPEMMLSEHNIIQAFKDINHMTEQYSPEYIEDIFSLC